MTEGRGATPCLSSEVTILGMGASNLDYMAACYRGSLKDRHNNKEGCIWTVNNASFIFQHDLAWNMHDMNSTQEERWAGFEGPVMTTRVYPQWPDALEFPLPEVVDMFKSHYLTNSIAYMLAYALWSYKKSKKKACKRVMLFGCDYDYTALPASDGTVRSSPYEHGKQCVEHWIGRCMEAGMEIGIAERSTLMSTVTRRNPEWVPYGYEITPPIFEGPKILGYKTPEYMKGLDDMLESIPDNPGNPTT